MRISWKQWLRGSLVPFALAACGSISSPALTRSDDQPVKNNVFVAAPGDEVVPFTRRRRIIRPRRRRAGRSCR